MTTTQKMVCGSSGLNRTVCICYAVVSIFLVLLSRSVGGGEVERTAEEFIEEADHYAMEQWDHDKALELLYEALDEFPENEEILWRISRAHADKAEVLQKVEEGEEETIEQKYQTARDYADRAIEKNPENSMAYTQRAIATGQIALYKGIWGSISLVKDTHEAVRKAVELDASNDIAHFVYARTHAEVSDRSRWARVPLGLGWANKEDALKHFGKAIELNTDFIMYRLYAARAFIEEGRYERARELLSAIPELEKQTRFDELYREESRKLLQELQNR